MTTSTVTSTNTQNLAGAAALDAVRIEAQRATDTISQLTGSVGAIDLNKVGADDARKIMSAEHKALGYRPPPGSLAAEAQAAAAKHPDAHLGVDASTLREAAVEDAARISSKRRPSLEQAHPAIDLDKVGAGEPFIAEILTFSLTLYLVRRCAHVDVGRAQGARVPSSTWLVGGRSASCRCEAPRFASRGRPRNPSGSRTRGRRSYSVRLVFHFFLAYRLNPILSRERDPNVAPTVGASIDLATVGTADAATIESAEHSALGYRPPATSLAAAAKTAAAAHPDASADVDKKTLEDAGRDDAERVREERGQALPETPGLDIVGEVRDGSVAGVNLAEVGTCEYRLYGLYSMFVYLLTFFFLIPR
jgi:hypothetical protein